MKLLLNMFAKTFAQDVYQKQEEVKMNILFQ